MFQDAKKGAKPTKSTKRTLQVTSSQEERRGALSLQLSQASDQPKKVQSLLRFKPVKRTEEASTEPQQQSETAADTVRHRGYGSQPDPAELPRGQGVPPHRSSTFTSEPSSPAFLLTFRNQTHLVHDFSVLLCRAAGRVAGEACAADGGRSGDA